MLGYFNKMEMSWTQVPVCFNFKFLFGRCCMKREIFMAPNGTAERKKIPVLMYGKTLFPVKSRACTFSKDVLGLQSSSSSEMWLQKHLCWHWSRLCREARFRWKSTYGACTDTGASCCAVTRSTIAHPSRCSPCWGTLLLHREEKHVPCVVLGDSGELWAGCPPLSLQRLWVRRGQCFTRSGGGTVAQSRTMWAVCTEAVERDIEGC